ncbi:hypothetical protein BDV95DRAFT_392285 [Massariosphaeria phaeospora]|uniref:Uncharacterized protein n=1 Tax=Massariosphaeria phaeospora TaxID=100035 RepID=A0A7C8MGD6_9PLEO|nr:hypothetical protein BDV95DRAFT_392285 [Massariosphaeria phaeospora]
MASSSSIRGGGFRYGLSMRVNRLRQKFKRPPDEACPRPPERLDVDPKSGDGLQPSSQPNDGADEIIATGEDNAHVLPNQTDLPAHRPERNSTLDHDSDSIPASSDLWSVAYCEAVKSFGKDVHVDILEAHNIAVLFTKLENTNEDKTHGSIFLRGVARLRSMQVPLETLRLGLDLTSPLSGIDPMTSTVFGVVRSVTAVSLVNQTVAYTRIRTRDY